MNKKETRVYKGLSEDEEKQQPDKETITAGRIIFDRMAGVIREERDFTNVSLNSLKRVFGRYTNSYEYEDGWRVRKLLLPDRATKHGNGYHKIALVTCSAETEAGISEAIRRAVEVKTKLEKAKAHITAETVIILSGNISFQEANRIRGLVSDEHRKVYIYSVKNAIGVAKNALNKFANLFTLRAQKIEKLHKLGEEMQNLADVLSKRGRGLFEQVAQLAKAFETAGGKEKKELRKEKDAAWNYQAKARKDWGVKVPWLTREAFNNPAEVIRIVNLAADRQGIDIQQLQILERETTGKEYLARLGSGC